MATIMIKALNQTIEIPHIDGEKITDGEILFKGEVYDKNGNHLRGIPYAKKEFPKLGWTIFTLEDYQDGIKSFEGKMELIKEEWRRSPSRLSDREFLQIFPEAKEIIPEKIAEWEEKRNEFSDTIKKKLMLIRHEVSEEFSQWFWREWVKVNEGQELVAIENHISRLKRLQSVAKGRAIKGRLTEEQIQQAKTVLIESLLNQQLKRSGDKLVGLCPLHNEKTASFYIYPQNTFWCFGCQQGGDVIEFVMLLHDFSFSEAVRWLNRG